MHDEFKKGRKVKVSRFYGDTLEETEGAVIKAWTIKNITWVKILFGYNLTGQKLTRTMPADCLALLEAS